ncbi:hypothetical protein [Paracoccus sp. (in: a-proteobacteria)]|uniref:hypothetical protein n=1 Tax=Paracoccus sp. TaxID=267 RepID=UPI002AFE04EF|nr:hypothetical protein [Paracoccus sp. (in: a-proteobacteria)]
MASISLLSAILSISEEAVLLPERAVSSRQHGCEVWLARCLECHVRRQSKTLSLKPKGYREALPGYVLHSSFIAPNSLPEYASLITGQAM